MTKKEIEKIELERDFYNIMTNYGKLGYKINKTIDKLNEISELSNLMAKEEKELKDRIQKAIVKIENLYDTNSTKQEIIYVNNLVLNDILNILKGGNK